MISEEKTIALKQYNSIVQATLDYNIERLGGLIVYDNEDIIADYYRQQKVQTEKYFQQRRLDKIQQQLATLTKEILHKGDIHYAAYIRDKTGYNVDIFEKHRKITDTVVAQDGINNEEEYEAVNIMLRFYQQTADANNIVNQLLLLQQLYLEKRPGGLPGTTKEGNKIKTTTTEVDGILITHIAVHEGSEPPDNEQTIISPDGQRRLYVKSGQSNEAAASVTIQFPSTSGTIFWAQGVYEIDARWKDNSTIVITIPKNCRPLTQCKQVRSFDDKISIEYLEAEYILLQQSE